MAKKADTGNFEQIQSENLQLKDAIKLQSLDLEQKNRELEIEASLERVRVVAMSMNRPEDMLDVCRVISAQLLLFNVSDIRNVQTAIIDGDKGIYFNYQYFTPYQTGVTEVIEYHKHPKVLEMVLQMQRSPEAFFSAHLKGEELDGWRQYRKDDNQFPDPILDEAAAVFFYFYSIGDGGLGISTYSQFTDEDLSIFKRFRNVFQLSYRRFLDIQKAEAQAREALIEASLERVRAQALTMYKTDDLIGVSQTLLSELQTLGFQDIRNTQIAIAQDEKGTYMSYDYYSNAMSFVGEIAYDSHPFIASLARQMRQNKEMFISISLTGQELDDWRKHLKSLINKPAPRLEAATELHYYYYSIGPGGLGFCTYTPLSAEAMTVLKRFKNVFDLAYRRFMDIQKAEAQAREAHIEAALERVRSRTMAMQRSDELSETAQLLFQQFKDLGEAPIQIAIGTLHEEEGLIEFRITDWAGSGSKVNQALQGSIDERTLLHKLYVAWKEQKKSTVVALTGKELIEWTKYRNSLLGIPVKKNSEETRRVISAAFFSKGLITMHTREPRPAESLQLLERFAGVFDLTYTRFLDLQKAEAQAREALIEVSLERIRAKAMGMHHSEELSDVLTVFFDQFDVLGIRPLYAQLTLLDLENNTFSLRLTGRSGQRVMAEQTIDIHAMDIWKDLIEKWKTSEPHAVNTIHYPKDTLPQLFELAREIRSAIPEEARVYPEDFPDGMYETEGYCKFGYIGFVHNREATTEEKDIVVRFATEFGRVYQRFLDLQKAEAQAREAQIEATLERVRAKAMAMHKSEDLNPAVATVFAELEKLSPGMSRCGIGILDREKRMANAWITSITDEGTTVQISGYEPIDVHPLLQGAFEAWLKQKDFSYVLKGKDMTRYYQTSGTGNVRLPESQLIFTEDESQQQHYYFTSFQDGGLFAFRETEFPQEVKSVMRRFADVFNLTYTRFLDLQRAEANARESQIEASLERVRAHAMAMHNSADLSSTVNIFFKELKTLGITPMRCGVGEMLENTHTSELVFTTADKQGELYELPGKLLHEGHPVVENIYNYWKSQEEYHPVLQGADIIEYYKVIKSQMVLPEFPEYTRHFGYYFYFKEGFFFAWAEKEFTEEAMNIFRKFTSVLSLTYKRYKDLKLAEANARDAIRQASLDRVRAETASMRTSVDLERITPLIWNELTTLGVPFIRCGVFIMDNAQQQIHTFLSTPDGNALAAFHLPYHTPGTTAKVLAHWRRNNMYVDHWDEVAFKEWTRTLVEQGAIDSSEKYLTAKHPTNLHLHFLPFLQGMLYVGSETPLNDEELLSVQNLADAFSAAYARYEDFNTLEAAKKQVDSTLNELQATQKQLIQSEKMASLGELTAGIAHEIQNPLNFVNNFSEVNSELIAELIVEIAHGNLEEVKNIANSIDENEKKIIFHGKRADSIVKGMLHHSRNSSGVKEPTDINALADEYLRLAYHGLRAKDKSFNATTKTDFDRTIGNINVIPQDIGRVILNLITNAFYACNERNKNEDLANGKRQTANGSYQPTVTVSTKKLKDTVEIRVADNGNGIPLHVLDKIFQPFFTTKPTGQGTGLGLSLSYDIVKAHGGELKVETEEGKGAGFIIILPL